MVNNPKREGFRISGVVLKLDIGRFVFFFQMQINNVEYTVAIAKLQWFVMVSLKKGFPGIHW